GFLLAAGHEAVADLQTPDATTGSGVDEADPTFGAARGARDGVVIVAVAAVDDGVTPLEQRLECRDGVVGHLPGRHHDPDATRLVEGGGELVVSRRRGRAERLYACARLRVGVIRHHGVIAVAAEPVHHVGAHPAKPHKADLHGGESFEVWAALSAPPWLR